MRDVMQSQSQWRLPIMINDQPPRSITVTPVIRSSNWINQSVRSVWSMGAFRPHWSPHHSVYKTVQWIFRFTLSLYLPLHFERVGHITISLYSFWERSYVEKNSSGRAYETMTLAWILSWCGACHLQGVMMKCQMDEPVRLLKRFGCTVIAH